MCFYKPPPQASFKICLGSFARKKIDFILSHPETSVSAVNTSETPEWPAKKARFLRDIST